MPPKSQNPESLLQNRLSIKSQLKRISEYVREFRVGDSSLQLSARNDKFEDIWYRYDEVQTKLEGINFEIYKSDREQFENEYYSTSAEIKRITSTQESITKASFQPKNQQQNSESNNCLSSKINLPKMNLPQFSGDYKEWRCFYDLFKAIIHENQTISKVEKLFYLKSSLTGEALKIIDSIPSTEDNYDTAFELLINRYDNSQLIINAHLTNLFSLNSISKQSAKALRDLITDAKQQIESLKALKLPIEHWDTILIYLLTQKLDFASRREWELRKTKDKLPNIVEFFCFLETRCISLEAVETTIQPTNKTSIQPSNRTRFSKPNQIVAVSANDSISNCHLCQGNHRLYKCDKFHALDVKGKTDAIKTAKVCFNCLNPGHNVKQCRASHCKKCSKPHSTFIHLDSATTHITENTFKDQQANDNGSIALLNSTYPKQILLSTAIIKIKNKSGVWINCRTLLDSGSQSNCITEKMINELGIEKSDHNSNIIGINGANTQVNKSVTLNIASRVANYQTTLEFLVLDKITAELPNKYINASDWNLPKNIKFADPSFNKPGQIDLLIGAEIYFKILKVGQRKLGEKLPILQNSEFGWIISGKIANNVNQQDNNSNVFFTTTTPNTDELLLKFWELENIPKKMLRTREESECEEHFQKTIKRNESGRFIAQLPVREEKINLIGNSREFAEQRLHYLWRRLSANVQLQTQYVAFMQEYLDLKHMELLIENNSKSQYFIPHHAVFKQINDNVKLRVVFDASMKSNTGISLNDSLKVGPVVQEDLLSIVMRFRLHKYVFTADIQKMYRQIMIDKEQQNYQLILWKFKIDEDVKTYRLRTVTYGTASAPYIATKCIQHLAITEGDKYPLAKLALLNNCYVDDIMTGANSLNEAADMQKQLIELLNKGGFTLHKWCANHSKLLNEIELKKRQAAQPLEIGKEAIKTLGLLWLPSEDKLKFVIKLKGSNVPTTITKRSILSDTAGIFDPLGLLGPIVIKAKMFLQKIWKLKITWDEQIPETLASEWSAFRKTLQQIENFEVDRRIIGTTTSNVKFEIHGFADASQLAYGACIYLKTMNDNNEVSAKLIAAKSKVAPVKPTTIPRLELCAALTLARLLEKVLTSLKLPDVSVHLWTDSTITLSWILSDASRYKIFVGNRVIEIQELTKNCKWHHVPTMQNPADCISRGITPSNLKECKIWWNGPLWLQNNESAWPTSPLAKQSLENLELKPVKRICTVGVETVQVFERFSSLLKLQRVTAFIRRFIHNTRFPKNKLVDTLSIAELNSALICLIKLAQQEEFHEEINLLKTNQEIKRGFLKSLYPFLDKENILRVGGRLQNSLRNFDSKHPIILPKHHKLTDLLINFEHRRLLHAGTQATLGSIRQKYWPIHGRSRVRKLIHNCVTCFRHRAKPGVQLMGNLPSYRTQPFRAFLNTGVDYGGPILIKSGNRRNSPLLKAYIALFVCLCTRAIHVELVIGLNTKAFLNAFKRFISRRGLCQTVHSDNATNFKGAARELSELYNLFQNQLSKAEIINEASKVGVQWKFIPPSSPHFGGIWEAGIKSVKYHLKRVIGNANLTFEETYTLLTQIEACVNSRPIAQISDDPTDSLILTPAHFLIGCPITAMPESDLTVIEETKLSKWQRMQAQVQCFWKAWSQDYLNTLQQRSKWINTNPNLKIGDVVLLKENNQPPLHWPLARVQEIHPGPDGKVRIVTITTATGQFKRPIHKLCLLPVNDCD